MKLYFEKDGLKSLIPDYVDSRYWSIYKEYRQSDEYPEYKRSDNQKIIYWSGHQIASIKTKTHLFGEIGIEPRKVKITIEKL
jgi:hypothetical protein